MKPFIVVDNKDYRTVYDGKVLKYYYYNKVTGQPMYQGFNYHELDSEVMHFGKYEHDDTECNVDYQPYTWERIYNEDPDYFRWLASKMKGYYDTYYEIMSDNKVVCRRCYLTDKDLFLDSNYCITCLFEKRLLRNRNLNRK